MNHIEYLQSICACDSAIKYARGYPTLAAAWDACDNLDWLLWLCDQSLTPQQRTLLACDLAETALPYAGDDETLLRCLLTLHIAREWAAGREDAETLDAAWDAAGAAAWAAARAAAWTPARTEQLRVVKSAARETYKEIQIELRLELYNIKTGRDPNGTYVMGSNFKTNVKKSKTNVKKSKSVQCWCGKKCNVHVPDAEI